VKGEKNLLPVLALGMTASAVWVIACETLNFIAREKGGTREKRLSSAKNKKVRRSRRSSRLDRPGDVDGGKRRNHRSPHVF